MDAFTDTEKSIIDKSKEPMSSRAMLSDALTTQIFFLLPMIFLLGEESRLPWAWTYLILFCGLNSFLKYVDLKAQENTKALIKKLVSDRKITKDKPQQTARQPA